MIPLPPEQPPQEILSGAEKGPVGRLAPSPTGHLHLGHARSFLLAFWHARAGGGRIILRFEDLDTERSNRAHIATAERDLEWLGLEWDGPSYLQSDGVERLMSTAYELVRQGLAYPCTCSRGDIRTASSAPHPDTRELRYPGTCRGRFPSPAEAEAQTGRAPGLRFVVRPGKVRVPDRFAGETSFDPDREGGDFLIARRDQSPAYQLAVVVDDLYAGVTEVVRGDDLLASAARQMLLLEALGHTPPQYYHVPLVCDASGRRLAKREDDLSLNELRDRGVDPRKIVEWVARRSGFSGVERPRAVDLSSGFRMENVPKQPVCITPDELAWLRQPG